MTVGLRWEAFFYKSLPYCFAKLKNKAYPHIWLPLNRDYKPLGVLSKEWIDYDDHIASALVFSRDPCKFNNVWQSVYSDACYLYNDGTNLDLEYFPRLHRLLSHAHKFYKEPSGWRLPHGVER